MPKIFDRQEAERTLRLVRSILEDLNERYQERREVTEDGDPEDIQLASQLRAIQREIQRHIDELEAIGCCVRGDSPPVVVFPAVKGSRLGFHKLYVGAETLGDWAPVRSAPVERGTQTVPGLRHGK